MGQSVMGINPSTDIGKDFFRQYSQWPPLWHYVLIVSKGILIDEQREKMELWLDEVTTRRLHNRLLQCLEGGHARVYLKQRSAALGSRPFDLDTLKSFIQFLEHSGGVQVS